MAEASANPFWQFSLAFYGQDDVAPACLRLQDRDGLDVNIVLYCCWAAEQGIALDAAAVARIADGTAAWRAQVIQPLRAVRRALRNAVPPVAASDGETLRQGVKQLELEAERQLQDALWRRFPLPVSASRRDVGGLARANLECYARAANMMALADTDITILCNALTGASRS